MLLSTEEIATAKKAYSEMRFCDNARTMLLLVSSLFFVVTGLFGVSIACGLDVMDEQGRDLHGWKAFLSSVSFISRGLFFVFLPMLGQVFAYRRLKPLYAENFRVVTEMEQKHAGEFPYGLEEELQKVPPTKPKKALLWRLDAFLSGKPISA